MRNLTRSEFIDLLKAGRKLVAAALYEKQDYRVNLSDNPRSPFYRVYRDITDDAQQLAIRGQYCVKL